MAKTLNLICSFDKLVLLPVAFSALSILLLLVGYLLFYNQIPPQIPLFYSLPWGQQQLAGRSQFFILPSLIALITFINLFLSWQLHPSQTVLKKILTLSLVLINLVILITALKIITIFV